MTIKKCKHCNKADVELVPAHGIDTAHWACPNCDSTYVEWDYPISDVEWGPEPKDPMERLERQLECYGPCATCGHNKADELNFEALIHHNSDVRCLDLKACRRRQKKQKGK